MNPHADIITESEATIADIDRRIAELRKEKPQATTLQRIHNLEVSRGNAVCALNMLREYEK